MPAIHLQARLRDYYQTWKDQFDRGLLACQEFSPPLLLSVTPGYASASSPALVFGQETFGWSWNSNLRRDFPAYPTEYKFADQDSLEDFLTQPDSIEALCWGYDQFALGKTQSMKSPFWRAFNLINRADNVLWSNISKCDYQGASILQLTPRQREDYFKQQNALVRAELEVLSPKVVIFFTGPNYDFILRDTFPGLVFEPAFDSGAMVSKLSHSDLPNQTFRTYHPNYLSRSKNWNYVEIFASLANEA